MESKNCSKTHDDGVEVKDEDDLFLKVLNYWVKRIKTEKYVPISCVQAEMTSIVERVEHLIKSGYYDKISLISNTYGGLVCVYDGNNVEKVVEDKVKHCIEPKNESESAESIAIDGKQGAEAMYVVVCKADHNHSTLSVDGSCYQQDNRNHNEISEVVDKSITPETTSANDDLLHITGFTTTTTIPDLDSNQYYGNESSIQQPHSSLEEKNGVETEEEEGTEKAMVEESIVAVGGRHHDLAVIPTQLFDNNRLLLSLESNLDDDRIVVGGHHQEGVAFPFAFHSEDYVAFKKLRGWRIFGRF